MRGNLEINVIDSSTGKVIKSVSESNAITDVMRLNVLKMAANISGDSGGVIYMQFGTGSQTESVDDENLQSPITPIVSVTTTYNLAVPKVIFTAYLLENQANGFPISEAGLLTLDGVLAARKVFSAIDKTVDYIIQFVWSISFN